MPERAFVRIMGDEVQKVQNTAWSIMDPSGSCLSIDSAPRSHLITKNVSEPLLPHSVDRPTSVMSVYLFR